MTNSVATRLSEVVTRAGLRRIEHDVMFLALELDHRIRSYVLSLERSRPSLAGRELCNLWQGYACGSGHKTYRTLPQDARRLTRELDVTAGGTISDARVPCVTQHVVTSDRAAAMANTHWSDEGAISARPQTIQHL